MLVTVATSRTTKKNQSSMRALSVAIFIVLFVHYNDALLNPPTPIMGWSTWCTYSGIDPCNDDWCSESEVVKIAKKIKSNGMWDLGYQWLVLDDCWSATNRTADNQIQPDPSRFPNGMLNLTTTVHALGFKLGLYTDVGEKACRNGRTGSWPFYKQDAATFARWGVDFVKMDWCDHPANYTPKALYTMMSAALNDTGRPFYFSMCEWGVDQPWTWAGEIANSARVAGDHHPVWKSTSSVIQAMAGLSKYTRPGYYNDPDFLEFEIYQTRGEKRTQFSFWALWAAPMVVASNPGLDITTDIVTNEEVIAVNQDALVDAGDLRINGTDGGQIWSRRLVNGWAIIVYNMHTSIFDHGVTLNVPLNDSVFFGYNNASKPLTFRDVWEHKTIGSFTGTFTSPKLAPRESRMYTVTISGRKNQEKFLDSKIKM